MGSVAISAEDLSVKRGKVVRRLLSPLLLTDHQAQVKHIGPGRDAYTLGALPIGAIASPAINRPVAKVLVHRCGFA